MNTKKHGGILTALLTPFDEKGDLNLPVLRRFVRYQLGRGVNGFYVCGSTGESFLLSKEERLQVMEAVKEEAPDSILIAHVGSLNEREAAELARGAKALEYDAVSSVAPFYFKFSFEEIRGYYSRLADAAELPMLVYHFPAFSGVNLGAEQMEAFLKDPRFLGIKYTSNDFFTLQQCKARFPEKTVYNGFDEMLLSGLVMGADGAIGSTYNFMPHRFVKLFEAFQKGDQVTAAALQKEANEIIRLLLPLGVMQGEKEIVKQLGFDFGNCRPPFAPSNEETKKTVKEKILPLL